MVSLQSGHSAGTGASSRLLCPICNEEMVGSTAKQYNVHLLIALDDPVTIESVCEPHPVEELHLTYVGISTITTRSYQRLSRTKSRTGSTSRSSRPRSFSLWPSLTRS